MDWTEGGTMKTTVNDVSNITFIERKHACRTELLKNGDGRTDLLSTSTQRHSICTISFFLSPAAKDIPVSSILP